MEEQSGQGNVLKLSTFYDVDSEGDVEICTCLEQSNRFFIVLHCPDYEQILLYDPISGKRERIKVTFKSQLTYCAVLEENHILYIAFDKKLIALDIGIRQKSGMHMRVKRFLIFM